MNWSYVPSKALKAERYQQWKASVEFALIMKLLYIVPIYPFNYNAVSDSVIHYEYGINLSEVAIQFPVWKS